LTGQASRRSAKEENRADSHQEPKQTLTIMNDVPTIRNNESNERSNEQGGDNDDKKSQSRSNALTHSQGER
jgi:hypothetical protein